MEMNMLEAKTAYTIEELVSVGPLGRSTIYKAIAARKLIAKKYGRRTFVLAQDWEAFLRALPAIGEAA
jgi:hypothetical protein